MSVLALVPINSKGAYVIDGDQPNIVSENRQKVVSLDKQIQEQENIITDLKNQLNTAKSVMANSPDKNSKEYYFAQIQYNNLTTALYFAEMKLQSLKGERNKLNQPMPLPSQRRSL